MTFSEKYELLESLTAGAVETFLANDRVRGERVLLHVLDCGPQKSNQPTVQWVLDGFRRVAPEPAGLVLETGRYERTLYAYLVVKMPEEAALRDWVEKYKAQGQATKEIAAPAAESSRVEQITVKQTPAESSQAVVAPAIEAPTMEISPQQLGGMPIPFTQMFKDFDSLARHNAPAAPPKENQQQPHQLPKLEAVGDQPSLHPALAWDAAPPRPAVPAQPVPATIAPAQEDPKISPPVIRLDSEFPAKTFPMESVDSNNAKTGEFTNFFRGPFHAEGPSEMPVTSRESENPRRSSGEFTRMFPSAAPSSDPLMESPRMEFPQKSVSSSGITGWQSNPNILSQAPDADAPPALSSQAANVAPVTPLPKQPAPVPQPPAQPSQSVAPLPLTFPPMPTPKQVVGMPAMAMPTGSGTDGATRAFRPAIVEPVPSALPGPSGPSPFTQIIMRPDASVEAVAQKEASTGSAVSSPALPAMPAVPKIKAPTPPAVKAPKVDHAKGDLAKAPAPPVSYWPLVLTLTVLFFIATILVLYFVLKH